MYSETAKRIASRDPGLAASWLESHLANKKVNGQVVGEVASRWVESDPGRRFLGGQLEGHSGL